MENREDGNDDGKKLFNVTSAEIIIGMEAKMILTLVLIFERK